MKFICTQENLTSGLSKVVPLAGRNTQLPILQNILLELRDGVLHLTCTDLEIGVHTAVPGKIESDGGCTVVARKFMEYIQQLPTSHPLQLELKDGSLHVDTQGFHAHFPTTSEDDFPLLPQAAVSESITLQADVVCRGLTHTIFSAARDETRPEIHSVYMKCTGGEIRIAATDSFRLTEEVINLEEEAAPFTFLLPLTTAQEVVRLFNDQTTIEFLPQANHITFQSENLTLSSRLIDGKYPDYQQIIAQSFVTTGQIEREVLLRALKSLL
ncbi:MAG: DNA polymerase III subunit beta, partial [Candidatus Andersenbacteria bacterium]